MTIFYEAYGPVCGACGHRHRTIRGAYECADMHSRAVRTAYPSTYPTQAYSDRHVRRSDGEEMTEREQAEVDEMYEEGA